MEITSYVELTPAQEKTTKAFERVTVRALDKRVRTHPVAVNVIIRTPLAQNIELVIDTDGVVIDTEVHFDSL